MNPKNSDDQLLVRRGGSWYIVASSWVRAASRLTRGTEIRNSFFGFRCALRGRTPRV
jgi:formylglycine-generating enzyme required for sulfatase activity